MVRVYVGLYVDQFEEIRQRAIKEGVGVAEVIRGVIYDGLEDDEDWEVS